MNTLAYETLKDAAQVLKRIFGDAPKVAVVLGSGLSKFGDDLKESHSINFTDLPGGKSSGIEGHSGKIVVGKIGEVSVLAQMGRIHGYEGHSPTEVVHLVRAYKLWGVENFILTNAAGSTTKALKPGRLVLISDHLNFTGANPLTGKELFGAERFPDMSEVYNKAWRKLAQKAGKKAGLKLREGVYVGLNGPNYETPAEIRMFQKLGGDLVGMSTVWEAIALRQMGSKILGISCVTNLAAGVSKKNLSHEEVLDTTKKAAGKFREFLKSLIETSF